MPPKTLNVALLGTKFMGKAHSNGLRQVRSFMNPKTMPVMKVIVGRDEAGTAGMAERFGWEEASTDWKAVIKRDDIDVVDIGTPGNLHAEMAVAAAKAGKHIVCEKPLANTVKEAEAMVKAVQQAGVQHMCGFTYRFNPAIQTIKAMIAQGALGELFHVRACYQQDWIVDPDFPINWRLQKATAGSGALGDIGAHIVDMAQYLAGGIAEVSSAMTTFINERPISDEAATIAAQGKGKRGAKKGKVDVDDAAIFVARFSNGRTLGTFEATRFAPGRRNYNCIEVYGSQGSVRWNQEDMHVFHYYNANDPATAQGFRRIHATDPGHPFTEYWWPSAHNIGYENLFAHELFTFFNEFGRKRVSYPTFEDGLACQRVLHAVEKANKSRKWEKV